MTVESNTAVVRAFYDSINRGAFEELGQYCHPDFVFYHQVDTPHPGVAGLIASEKKNFDAFDDWRMEIEKLVADGDTVVAYMIFEGTHARDFMGVSASMRHIRFSLAMWLTLKDGKLIEKRAHFDAADIRDQLAR